MLFLVIFEDDKSDLKQWGGLTQWLASRTKDQGVPGSRPGRGAPQFVVALSKSHLPTA